MSALDKKFGTGGANFGGLSPEQYWEQQKKNSGWMTNLEPFVTPTSTPSKKWILLGTQG